MIANHDPKPLSAAVAQKLSDGGYAEYIRKHPVATMDAPSPAVLTQWAKGAPNGLVDISEKETISIRNYNITPQLPPNGFTVAELFCGGGLMAVGLKAAGYDLIFANDFDKRAAQAYAYNIGDHVVCGDITGVEIQAQIPDADIIAGGPPCQDYSVAGTGAGEAGERGRLVWTYLDIIARKQPKAFVFENVKGLITKKHRPTFDALLAEFDRIGYTVSWRLINAWDYGVAQKRERVFIVGIRKDLGFTFEFPEPTAEEYRTQVLRDVIGDLPEPYTKEVPANQDKLPISAFREYIFDSANDGANWDEPSWTIRAGTITGQPWHPSRYENHEGARPTQEFGQREKGVGRHPLSSLDDAAYTIVASTTGGKNAVNTSQPRRFTVRECLRIQSVPDWYVLPDTISLSAQYRIVGNGVASRVAYRIGEALASQLSVALAAQLNAALAASERRAA